MKFLINSVTKEGCRRGVIKEIGCHANLAMETPICLMYTRAGAVPHMTWDRVKGLENQPQCVQFACSTLVDQQETLAQYGRGMTHFAGMEGRISFVSVQDPAHPSPTGYNEKQSVSVFTPAGRIKLDVTSFMALQESIQPDWFEALCDGDTPLGCSVKRSRKSVDRSLDMLDRCVEARRKSEKLRKADLFGVIEGGHVTSERQRSARETALRPVAGFVLDALSERHVDAETRWGLLAAIVPVLPEDKPRLLPGVGKPNDVLRAVESGIDIFDSSYPYEATERGCALVFPCQHTSEHTGRGESGEVSTLNCETAGKKDDEKNYDAVFEMDLSEKRFAEDLGPVRVGCECYCCSHHSRAYINHLLNVKELLAKILLMIHNTHHYYQFFHSIRKSLRDGTFQLLKEAVDPER